MALHPEGTSKDSDNLRQYQKILSGFIIVAYEKINIFSCVQKTRKYVAKITLD